MQPNKNNADEPQTTQLPPNRSAFEVVPLSTSIESVPELLANFRALNDEQLKANLGPIVTLYEAAFKEYGITREELMSFLIYLVRFSDPVQYPAISKYAYRTFDYFKRDVNRFVPMKGIETLIIVYNRILQTPPRVCWSRI